MLKSKSEGDRLTITAATSYVADKFYASGDRALLAMIDASSGDKETFLLEGIITYAKAAVAMSPGDKLYYDAGADAVTKTVSSNKPCGWAASVQASGDSTVDVKLGAF